MTKQSAQFQFVPLSTIVANARSTYRGLLGDVSRWALKNGVAIDRDVVALILVSKGEKEYDSDFFYWRRTAVYSDLWATAFNYTSLRGGLIPENIGEQMWRFLDYLVATDQLDPRSDPISALREPLHCYWWLDRDGNVRSDEGRRYAPCRCRVEYQESEPDANDDARADRIDVTPD